MRCRIRLIFEPDKSPFVRNQNMMLQTTDFLSKLSVALDPSNQVSA